MDDTQRKPVAAGEGLSHVERAIDEARRQLRALWRSAPSTDRLYALDRLLAADVLSLPMAEQLHEQQARIRAAWATVRVARAVTAASSTSPLDAQVAALHLQMVERDRDNLLTVLDLWDALFLHAESFLRTIPAGASLRELFRRRDQARARLIPILPPVVDDAA